MTPDELKELKEMSEQNYLPSWKTNALKAAVTEIERLTAANSALNADGARMEKALMDEQLCEQCGGNTRPQASGKEKKED